MSICDFVLIKNIFFMEIKLRTYFRVELRLIIKIYKNCNISVQVLFRKEGRKEMFYLMEHSTHFIYGYMASDIW